eukprot:GILK01003833.1.p1 GENE.GILK01003833.1~~GILK01003833.1.p1  ORF type:complete len:507 (-),score=111.28 GILK01003833.1:211-1677(-)
MSEESMLTALVWVPKGAAKLVPDQFEVSEEELKAMQAAAAIEEQKLEQKRKAMKESSRQPVPVDESMAEADDGLAGLNMDNYDEEDSLPAFGNDNDMEEDDPYLDVDEANDSEEEIEDYTVKKSDAMIVCASTEKEFSVLEVYLYDESTESLYVHHDIQLSAFPLCLEWMEVDPRDANAKGNFVAVGSFLPGIEIWNLDVMDVLEPVAVLGGGKKSNKPMTQKRMMKDLKEGSHTAAVMSLSANVFKRNILASGSADNTVKVWDVSENKCMYTYSHHSNKVQSVKWNPVEATVFLSGGYDRTVFVVDARSPNAAVHTNVSADIESVIWNPHNPFLFVASTEDGLVTCHDVRMMSNAALFTLSAHDKATTGLTFSHAVPDMLATCSLDKTVKIWDVADNKPKCVASKQMNIGKVLCLSFYKDSPFLLSAGGSTGQLAVWDTLENKGVQHAFSKRVLVPVSLEEYQIEDNESITPETNSSSTKKKQSKNL